MNKKVFGNEKGKGARVSYHFGENRLLHFGVRLLVDGLEEEGILGEPLHGLDEDVHEAEAVAIPLRFAPLPNVQGENKKEER